MNQYLALLRGINVGGKNVVRMADLRACLEADGLADVATYIQSGNVLFEAAEADRGRLERAIEDAITTRFGHACRAVVRSREEMRDVVDRAPDGFGSKPDTYRYDVIFLKSPLVAAEAMKSVMVNEAVDRAFPGEGVLYFSRLTRRAAQSRLSRLTGTHAYQSMTIRNWNTTVKLLGLMEGRG